MQTLERSCIMSNRTGAKCLWEHSAITHEKQTCPTKCTSQQADSISIFNICAFRSQLFTVHKGPVQNPTNKDQAMELHVACTHRKAPFSHISYSHIALPDSGITYEPHKIKYVPKLVAKSLNAVKVPNVSLTVGQSTEVGKDCIQSWGFLPKPILSDYIWSSFS